MSDDDFFGDQSDNKNTEKILAENESKEHENQLFNVFYKKYTMKGWIFRWNGESKKY